MTTRKANCFCRDTEMRTVCRRVLRNAKDRNVKCFVFVRGQHVKYQLLVAGTSHAKITTTCDSQLPQSIANAVYWVEYDNVQDVHTSGN